MLRARLEARTTLQKYVDHEKVDALGIGSNPIRRIGLVISKPDNLNWRQFFHRRSKVLPNHWTVFNEKDSEPSGGAERTALAA